MPEMTVQQALEFATQAMNTGKLGGAEYIFRQILAAFPEEPDAWHRLGIVQIKLGRLEEGIASVRRVIELRPTFPDARNSLGLGLHRLGRLDEAMAAFREAIGLNPLYSMAHLNLGNSLREVGANREAMAAYRRAVELDPANSTAASFLCYLMHYDPAATRESILAEHRRWNERYAEPLRGEQRPHENDRDLRRRLRVGYVSPDFRSHCQSLFTVPLLSHHDHKAFEIFCYADVLTPDAVTERLRGYADVWRGVCGLADAQIAQQVREDRIDILVDLTMHMGGGHLGVFARRPAPVQVTWLAYPGTTGVKAIDYRLTDPRLDPPGAGEAFYAEESIRLPETFWCYDPLTDRPGVNELPMIGNGGRVTFGCLNHFCKVNERTAALWERVFRKLPGSRLIVLSPEGKHRQRFAASLRDVLAEVEFVCHMLPGQYLETYHRIDLAMETFPYNGHTTNLDGLWMGVPAVTMAGETAVSRAGLSHLTNLGLEELVASDDEEYVKKVVGLAKDGKRLAALRAGLRGRMERSPLMDGGRFARNMEGAYRELWGRWCATV